VSTFEAVSAHIYSCVVKFDKKCLLFANADSPLPITIEYERRVKLIIFCEDSTSPS